MVADVRHEMRTRTVQDLIHYHEKGTLNLSPGFQRKSVWKLKDQQRLIESIFRNYPIPAIFLYKRQEGGKTFYDVLDGKQRIEAIFSFMGLLGSQKCFDATVSLPNAGASAKTNWTLLKRQKLTNLLCDYQVYTIEVDGDLGAITELFVRINSTGKPLNTAEKQHAQFSNSVFLKECGKLADKWQPYFQEQKIISAMQADRMKHIEFMSELMISIHQGEVTNKKAALHKVLNKDLFAEGEVIEMKVQTQRAIGRVRSTFPDLQGTRFTQLSDYFILVFLIAKYEEKGMVLNDRRRNDEAWKLLKRFSTGLDQTRENQKAFKGISEDEQLFRDYLQTVESNSDDRDQRKRRMKILDSILSAAFQPKDGQRGFSIEQRRILWHSSERKTCSVCDVPLTWENFTIDHVIPHSRGGRSVLQNAVLMCRKHNSAKGNRV